MYIFPNKAYISNNYNDASRINGSVIHSLSLSYSSFYLSFSLSLAACHTILGTSFLSFFIPYPLFFLSCCVFFLCYIFHFFFYPYAELSQFLSLSIRTLYMYLFSKLHQNLSLLSVTIPFCLLYSLLFFSVFN